MAQARSLPLAAGALQVDGTVYTHTSVRGDVAPELHPLIRRLLHDLPAPQRERFTGWCAEPILLSDRLSATEQAAGSLSPSAARLALWGARIRVVRIRESGDPRHGEAQQPCRSCAALLDHLAVEVIP